jgi:hypothetical protein
MNAKLGRKQHRDGRDSVKEALLDYVKEITAFRARIY